MHFPWSCLVLKNIGKMQYVDTNIETEGKKDKLPLLGSQPRNLAYQMVGTHTK